MANSDDRYEMLPFRELSKLSWVVKWRKSARGVQRNVVLARGELDKLEWPKYAARRAE